MEVKIEESWKAVLAEEFEKPYFASLASFVKTAYCDGTVYPPPGRIFEAFRRTPFDKVKAVIVAELYGTPAKTDEIAGLCRKYGVPLIEDAAESLGATYKGRPAGSLGDINVISFNGNNVFKIDGNADFCNTVLRNAA